MTYIARVSPGTTTSFRPVADGHPDGFSGVIADEPPHRRPRARRILGRNRPGRRDRHACGHERRATRAELNSAYPTFTEAVSMAAQQRSAVPSASAIPCPPGVTSATRNEPSPDQRTATSRAQYLPSLACTLLVLLCPPRRSNSDDATVRPNEHPDGPMAVPVTRKAIQSGDQGRESDLDPRQIGRPL